MSQINLNYWRSEMRRYIKSAVLLTVMALLFSACSAGNAGTSAPPSPPQTSTTDPPPPPSTSKPIGGEADNSNSENTGLVITIDAPNDTPVADADGKIPTSDNVSNIARDTVLFGQYYQDAAGAQLSPIEWIVLDEKDGYSLLLTKQIIDSKGWINQGRDAITWADSDLKQWLAGEFFNTAFTAEEQAAVATFDVTQPQNPRYSTPAGEPTLDKVTLLSYQELVKYMPTDSERKVKPTAYAVSQGCYENGDGDAAWWLRSPGESAASPEYLASAGSFGARTHYNDERIIGVRPAIWVKTTELTR